MLAVVDAAHEDLPGPAVRCICQRKYEVFGNAEYERMAGIPVSHIYNQRRYRAGDYRTPYEELVSLPTWQTHPKQGVTAELLQRQATRISDTEAAQRMQNAKPPC